jgi:hypothetical protein
MTITEAVLALNEGELSNDPPTIDDPTAALIVVAGGAWLELMVEEGWPRPRVYGILFCDAPGGPYSWNITGYAEREL